MDRELLEHYESVIAESDDPEAKRERLKEKRTILKRHAQAISVAVGICPRCNGTGSAGEAGFVHFCSCEAGQKRREEAERNDRIRKEKEATDE